jgi:hypothetical protein
MYKLLHSIILHSEFLPENTDILVWTSKEFEKELKGLVKPGITFKTLTHRLDLDKYNEMLTMGGFWGHYDKYDRVLIFQTDSGLLRSGIEEFYKWDYIGAEWNFIPHVGNGGLSLRNPKVMKEICENTKYQYHLHGPEDTFFCNIMRNRNGNLASVEAARRFSVESVFTLGSMGYHAIEKYLTPDQCKQIYEQYR